MIFRFSIALTLIYFFLTNFSFSEEFIGKVIKVLDGDTIEFTDLNNYTEKIRLSEIDAPEKNQSFGKQSKNNLIKLCEGKQGKIKVLGEDRYERKLAILYCEETNANIYQLKTGMAWVFDHYVSEYEYYKYQNIAKKNKLGLWSQPFPLPPWEFRKGNKSYDLEEKYENLKNFTDQQLKIYEEKISELTQYVYELLEGNMNFNLNDKYDCNNKTCSQMSECSEAYFQYQQCGNDSLDMDKDGVPCESICI